MNLISLEFRESLCTKQSSLQVIETVCLSFFYILVLRLDKDSELATLNQARRLLAVPHFKVSPTAKRQFLHAIQ